MKANKLLILLFLWSLSSLNFASCANLYKKTTNKLEVKNNVKDNNEDLSGYAWNKLKKLFLTGLTSKRFKIASDEKNLGSYVKNCYGKLDKSSDLIEYSECYLYDAINTFVHNNSNAMNFAKKPKKHIAIISNTECADSISGFFSSGFYLNIIVTNYYDLLKKENKWFLNVEPPL